MKMKTCQFHKNKALLHYYPQKKRFLKNWRPISLLNTDYNRVGKKPVNASIDRAGGQYWF